MSSPARQDEEDRVEALRVALKRQARDHERLRPATPRNGAEHVAVVLAPGGPIGIFRVDLEGSSLIVVDHEDVVTAREPLDLRFEETFCWDDIICTDEDQLADLLLVRAEHLLEQLTS